VIVAETRAELRTAITSARSGSASRVGMVPTMGALHEGHRALIEEGRGRADLLVASIFVNPMQFGPGEDLERYPRTFDADLELCAAHGVDVVFAPGLDEVYPWGPPQVTVDPGPSGEILEGASRPGHFRGVLTVVAKLFELVEPEVAVFGEKDYQQLALISQMARDLSMPIEVVGVPTVREPDGLAMSSRNRYLDAAQRRTAVAISRALFAGRDAASRGASAVIGAAQEVLSTEPGVVLDYLVLRGPALEADPGPGSARLLIAARVGTTRLIDNVGLELS
jgi:pantoate--beta-alanine ligase